MLLLQATGDITENPAYDLGYSSGYFVGDNSTLILLVAGLVFGLIIGLFFKSRKKRLSLDL